MKTSKRVRKYALQNFNEVLHTTLNPEGPGVVRVHLIPPTVNEGEEIGAGVAIINGQDIIPVNTSWTILLSEFIREVNCFSGREINEEETVEIVEKTCKNVSRVFPLVGKKRLKNDIFVIMNTFKQIAYGEEVTEPIEYVSIKDYAPKMRAPHRMDLMVSAMTRDGKWHCNQKCVHCYASGQECAEEAELGTEEWKNIIDKCRESMIPQLTFTGGEPTMRDDLVELIDYSKWFVTRLNTNGILLTEDFCRKLADASLDSVQITFYSYDHDIHNALVGAYQYENTVAGIRNALAAGLSVSINTPLCTSNRDYVKTLEFLNSLGVTYVTCSGLITTGNALTEESESLQLGEDEIKQILIDSVAYCTRTGMEMSFTSPGWIEDAFFKEYGLNTPNCGACLSNMAVTPGGNVVPCQSYLTGAVLGNMLKDEWTKIWDSPLCRERREFSAKTLGICPLRRRHEN